MGGITTNTSSLAIALFVAGTVVSGSGTSLIFTINSSTFAAAPLADALLRFTSGTSQPGITYRIVSATATNGGFGATWTVTATLHTALAATPSGGETVVVLYTDKQTNISSLATSTSIDDLPTNAELATALAAADDAVLAAISSLQVSVNNIVDDVFTTQLTESYAADGVAPTLTQAVFLMQQAFTEFVISGTSILVKKLDGTTTAATYTMNSATLPTQRLRAS